MILEICVDQLASVQAAVQGSADRLELCSALCVGGLTPTEGLLEAALEVAGNIPVMAMIRPRPGDFCYGSPDLAVMRREIASVKRRGVAGVVFGVLNNSGGVDVRACRDLIDLARPLEVTFHRAFDCCPDPVESLEQLIEMGADRVLTSGQADSAFEGAAQLRALQDQSRGRITVIAGAGVDCHNLFELVSKTGVSEVHASASDLQTLRHETPGFLLGDARRTEVARVRRLAEEAARATGD